MGKPKTPQEGETWCSSLQRLLLSSNIAGLGREGPEEIADEGWGEANCKLVSSSSAQCCEELLSVKRCNCAAPGGTSGQLSWGRRDGWSRAPPQSDIIVLCYHSPDFQKNSMQGPSGAQVLVCSTRTRVWRVLIATVWYTVHTTPWCTAETSTHRATSATGSLHSRGILGSDILVSQPLLSSEHWC